VGDPPQLVVSCGGEAEGQRRCQPRLADARLARDQHHPSFTALRLLPSADKQFDFLIAPDEQRRLGTQCREAAQNLALANDPSGRLRLGKPGERLRPEIGEIEQPADLPASRLGDDQRVRRGQSL
jgi:hypothetical protein